MAIVKEETWVHLGRQLALVQFILFVPSQAVIQQTVKRQNANLTTIYLNCNSRKIKCHIDLQEFCMRQKSITDVVVNPNNQFFIVESMMSLPWRQMERTSMKPVSWSTVMVMRHISHFHHIHDLLTCKDMPGHSMIEDWFASIAKSSTIKHICLWWTSARNGPSPLFD